MRNDDYYPGTLADSGMGLAQAMTKEGEIVTKPLYPEFVTIEFATRAEVMLVTTVLQSEATRLTSQGQMLRAQIPSDYHGKYHPNREMARCYDVEAETLVSLAQRIGGQL